MNSCQYGAYLALAGTGPYQSISHGRPAGVAWHHHQTIFSATSAKCVCVNTSMDAAMCSPEEITAALAEQALHWSASAAGH